MKIVQIISALILLAVLLVPHASAQMAKATLIVVNENGLPVDDVDVGIGFEVNTFSGTKSNSSRGLTDMDGRFSASGGCDGIMFYNARKKDYYYSAYRYDFKTKNLINWQPWNPELKVVVRKIENPVPMYARMVRIDLPVLGEDIGYDLIAYDMVIPYGRGTHSDIIFNATKRVKNKKNYEAYLKISFANQYDGVQFFQENLLYGSDLKLPKVAPISGYSDSWELSKTRDSKNGVALSFSADDNYMFRVRSVEKDGKLEKAMYGKILGPMKIGNITRSETATVSFKYYLNPDYTRNLEFDPKRNLFGKLPPLERVGIK